MKENMIDVEEVEADVSIETDYRYQICFYHYTSSEADLAGQHLRAHHTEDLLCE